MKQIILKTSQKTNTRIIIGHNLQAEIKKFLKAGDFSKIVFITNNRLKPRLKKYLSVKDSDIFALKPGETEKNLRNLERILQFLFRKNVDKKSLIVGVGGGVISDITGFAASIFYRGIPVAFIPTTLLAQVDAAIGGKNTINMNEIKNVIGAVNQPQAIFIDTNWLKTLPKKEFASGMGEIIKYGVGFDKKILFEKNIEKLIKRSVKIKAQIVGKDPLEHAGERKLLNLGHTLGHALEAQKQFNLSHGEAVAIGLNFACFVAYKLKNITLRDTRFIEKILRDNNLPVRINFNPEKTLNKILHDKKRVKNHIDFITIKRIGEAYIHKISLSELKQYLTQFIC